MKRRTLFAMLVIPLLLGMFLGACGGGGGAANVDALLEKTPYTTSDGNISIRYPKGYKTQEMGNQVVFYENEEALSGTAPTTPVVMMMVVPGMEEIGGAMDSRGILGLIAKQAGPSGMQLGSVFDLTVGGKKAAAADFKASSGEVEIAGRLVFCSEEALLLIAAGKSDTWGPFAPTFEAMLTTVQFK